MSGANGRAGLASGGAPILDAYLLRMLWGPLALTLGTVLVVLLLARLLRLFDLVAASGAALAPVLLMLANLVPHYLGLALPAAFFASLFMVAARLGDSNELDALLGSGRSIAQVAAPFLWVSLAMAAFCLYLFGFLQPYTRYEYNLVREDALHAGWDARLQQNMFADAGGGLVLTADELDPSGRILKEVFLLRRGPDGREQVTTARGGVLRPTADGERLLLDLTEGQTVAELPQDRLDVIHFESGTADESLRPDTPPFRPRGDSERELTLPELWRYQRDPSPPVKISKLAGEFQARLARVAAVPLLPLLAFPLGMAAKRGRRVPGIVVGAVLMLMLHHGLQLGESLAEGGKFNAALAVWLPYSLFAAASAWLFLRTLSSPGENPVSRAVSALESLLGGVRRRRPARPVAR